MFYVTYKASIYYSVPTSEAMEAISQKASEIADDSLGIDAQAPGPCWEAFISFEGESFQEVKQAAEKLVRYIKRFKDHKFY